MKWKKLGKIFDPYQHTLANECFGFAQSPQTLVFDDYVRIYFSTRKKDTNGKFLSHIAYVDFDKDLKNILRTSDHTVIELGKLGAFDEHGIFPINPVRDGDRVLAYTCGWSRRVSVSVETSIGLAASSDGGETFQKLGEGPVLSSSLIEPFLVGDGFVVKYNNIFHMWYIYGTRWLDPTPDEPAARVYKIAHATSADGVTWQKEGRAIIPDKLNADECQALPTVIFFDNRYHMFFCYREATGFRTNPNRGYRIGYAYSDDLVNWTRDDSRGTIETKPGEWDADMQCYPHVFSSGKNIYLLYNGNEFGKYGFGLAVLEKT